MRLPEGVTIELGRGSSVAVAPDSSAIVFRGDSDGADQLYLRPLASLEARPIAGTSGGADPFFSADGRAIGFFAEGKLKRVALDGSSPLTLADAPNPRGSIWAADDFIYLTPRNNTGVWRVPASGGKLEPVTTIADGQLSHRWPSLAPGGKALLYTVWNDTGWSNGEVVWHPLDGHQSRVLVQGGGFARIIDLGAGRSRLVYAQGRKLMAAPFDLATGMTSGPAVVAVENLNTNMSGGGQFDVSADGSLAYLPAAMNTERREVVWVDRNGEARPAGSVAADANLPELSPDKSRLAYYRTTGATRHVWVDHLATQASTQLTTQADPIDLQTEQSSSSLAWSPDGRQLAFASGPDVSNLFRVFAARPGSVERLTTSEHAQTPASWSPDGRTLAYVELDPLSGKDIWLLTLQDGAPAKARAFLRTPFNELSPVFSPDGKWIAYHSNESGRFEVYVQPFPAGGRQTQISFEGGGFPRWSPDGREMFFMSDAGLGALMSVRLDAQAAVVPGSLRTLFDTRRYDRTYAVSPDGKRLLMTSAQSLPGATGEVSVVLNWRTELNQVGARP
jgi:eukaryotic-like serine/threonine-protein kinase